MTGILVYFGDMKTAQEIMETGNPFDQWKFGRRVQGYANDRWNAVCQDVVRTGNMAKVDSVSTVCMLTFENLHYTVAKMSMILSDVIAIWVSLCVYLKLLCWHEVAL